MTLPDERYRAVKQAYGLLRDLCDPSKTPRVPREIRERAAGALRHYPSSSDLDAAAQTSPHIFTKQLDPLYKMIKVHEMGESVKEELDPSNK